MSRSYAFGFSRVLKIRNKLHDISQELPAVQQHATPERLPYRSQRAVMHSETQFSTQVRLPAPLYINLYSERAFRLSGLRRPLRR